MFNKQQKKMLKKALTKKQQKQSIKGLIHSACIGKDFDSWRFYAIFDRSKVKLSEVYNELCKIIEPKGVRANYTPYDCSGNMFTHRAKLRILPTRIIVIQWQGLDV